jgi:hypothetical protein
MEELKNLLKEDIKKGYCKFQESHNGMRYCPFPVNLDCGNYLNEEISIITKGKRGFDINNFKKCKL